MTTKKHVRLKSFSFEFGTSKQLEHPFSREKTVHKNKRMTDEDLRYIKDKHLADVLEDLMSTLVRDKPTDVVLAIRAWTDRKGMAAVSKGSALGLSVEGGGQNKIVLAPVTNNLPQVIAPVVAQGPPIIPVAPVPVKNEEEEENSNRPPPSPKNKAPKGGFAFATKTKKPTGLGATDDDITALQE